MKTILFLALMSPLSAFASYKCLDQASPRGLFLDTHDSAHVQLFADHQFFAATVVANEPGPFSSTTYELKNGLGEVEGTFVIHTMPLLSLTRGGPSCGRAGCFPDNDAPASTPAPAQDVIVTGTLNINGLTSEFSCDEVTP
jgi:hypothetical protein